MKINLGSFGNLTPEAGHAPRAGAAAIAQGMEAQTRAVQGLAAAGTSIGEEMIRTTAANALLEREIQVKTKAQEIRERVARGDLPYQQARQVFDAEVGKITAPRVDGLDAITAENFSRAMRQLAFNEGLAVDAAAQRAEKAAFRGQVATILDNLGKLAGLPDADIDGINRRADDLLPMLLSAEVPQDQAQNIIQGFKDKNWLNHATQRAMTARDSITDLQQLAHDLTDGNGYYAMRLDTDKRNSVLSGVLTRIQQLEHRQAVAADRREARAGVFVDNLETQIQSGSPISPELWAQGEELARGTIYEQRLADLRADEAEVQRVLRLPPAEQLAFVQQKQAEFQASGETHQRGRDRMRLQRLQSAVQNNLKQLQEAPLLFYQNRTGEEVAPLDIAALATPDGTAVIGAQLQDRLATIVAMRKQLGTAVPMRLLLPQEAEMLSQSLAQATPHQQANTLGTLAQALGNPEAYKDLVQQIFPDSPVRALAGMLVQQKAPAVIETRRFLPDVKATGAEVATVLLEGEAILNKTRAQKGEDGKPGNFPLPPETDFRAKFADQAGNVFAGRPQAYETAMQAVRAYYTGKAAQDGDVSGEINAKRLRQAITAVLGEVVESNGHAALAPWGMDEDTFYEQAKAAYAAEARRLGMGEQAVRIFDELGLRNKGANSYYLMQGRNYLTDPSGEPVVITVGGAES